MPLIWRSKHLQMLYEADRAREEAVAHAVAVEREVFKEFLRARIKTGGWVRLGDVLTALEAHWRGDR